jgi:SAM-dependent methyltransferase
MLEQGGRVRERVRERLREGVEQALTTLANGFLACGYRPNDPLQFYGDLQRLVYRMLFLLVAENRGLMSTSDLYRDHYSISRLVRLSSERAAYTDDVDLWDSLRELWRAMRDERLAAALEVTSLNGELFEPLPLDECRLHNDALLQAIWHLGWYRLEERDQPRRVNYAALDTEDLGSLYESLLDYRPLIGKDGETWSFSLSSGSERKTTGSYYTPPQLIHELIESALQPVLEARLKAARSTDDKIAALLRLKVLDPACGSGHFLLAAARYLGRELARLRHSESEPSPDAVRQSVREVIAHCIYGVDKNPLAIELARVALWIESHDGALPLTFLNHRIKCGDALVGVSDLSVIGDGVPDAALQPLLTDDKQIAAGIRKRNRREQAEQIELRLFDQQNFRRWKLACDLWTAAFFQQFSKTQTADYITTRVVRAALTGEEVDPMISAFAETIALEQRFFHWPLEFPDVFAPPSTGEGPGVRAGGFDVVLSNPPWERIKLQEQEFFASRDAGIAAAPNAAARKRLIDALPQTNPDLWQEYQRTLHAAGSVSRFLRGSGCYPLTGRGDINTYSVFAERIRTLLAPDGWAGVILPTGIATDATNQHFFVDLVTSGTLVSLFDFENREAIFPDVNRRYKFCLLTIHGQTGGSARRDEGMRFAFFATRTDHLRDPRRVFSLTSADITHVNPNTRTLPVFRTRQDAELTRAIYDRVPVLVREGNGEEGVGKADSRHASLNPWGVRFLEMFHMGNDSHLFRTRTELEGEGYRLVGNVFVRESGVGSGEWGKPDSRLPTPDSRYLPLYEAKMIWHYDHRFGTYHGVSDRSSTHLPTPDAAQHAEPDFVAIPWYWVPAGDVQQRLGNWQRGWLLGFRDVTNATNERTAIFSLLPRVGASGKLPLVTVQTNTLLATCWYANVNSITFDFVTRQKVGGVSLSFFILRQLPALPPAAYTAQDIAFIVPRLLELTYTAWDMAPFAADVWRELGMENGEWGKQMREEIIRQWEACHGNRLVEFLSRFGRLERGNEPGGDVLSPDRNLSQGGALRDDRSDAAGRRLGSGDHRQGLWPGEAWGIETILAHLAGFLERSGNPSAGSAGHSGDSGDRAAAAGSVRSGRPHPESFDSLLAEIITAPDSPIPIPPFRWDEERRAILRAELDAYYARLYGLTRKQLRYILDPADLTPRELTNILDPWEEVRDPLDPTGYAARVAQSDFPGETFRVLKEKEQRQYGEYRTRRLVLEAWERLTR